MAARTLEQILTEQIGGLVLALARATADVEAARDELAALKAAPKVPNAG